MLLMLSGWIQLQGGLFRRVSLQEIVEQADAIVVGQVFTQRSYWDAERRFIWTDSVIQISQAVKGTPPSILVVTSMGGEVGNEGMVNTAAEIFRPGEEVLLFLIREGQQWRTLNMAQGKFDLRPDPDTGEVRIQGALPGGVLTEKSGAGVDGWRLRHFLSAVRELAARSTR